MLNRNKERELAYVVLIDSLEPIEGRDFVECAGQRLERNGSEG